MVVSVPFTNPIIAGTTLVREAIRSPNYVPGASGWTINKDGSVEFGSATVRGTVDATALNMTNASEGATFRLGGDLLVQAPNFGTGPAWLDVFRLSPTGVLIADGTTDWINAKQYGATGDGTTDDTAALQKALNAAALAPAGATGRICYLPSGMYRTTAPLNVPSYVHVIGAYANRGTNNQRSCIKPLSSFLGAGVIILGDGTYGQKISQLTIDGSAAKAATLFSGVRGEGDCKGVVLRDVSVTDVSDRGVQSATVGSNHPYSWHLDNVQVSNVGVDGFRFGGMTDTTMFGCRAIGCGRDGYQIDGMANSTFTACRSEWNGRHGWYVTASWGNGNGSGGASWVNCSTDRNEQNGFLVDATGAATLAFTGLMLRRDGRNSGTGFGGYSAFVASNATCTITVDGNSYVGCDDNGTGQQSPQHGLRAVGSTWVGSGTGYWWGYNDGWSDGGGNGAFLRGTAVGLASGPSTAPVRI